MSHVIESETRIVALESLRPYIKEGQFEQFAGHFSSFAQAGATIFTLNRNLVGGVLSPDAAKNYYYDSLKSKLIERPELISKIQECLQDDDLVD